MTIAQRQGRFLSEHYSDGSHQYSTVRPESFGAKRDGVSDDTAAISAALNSGAHVIVLSPGSYVITSISVTVDHSVSLIGSGMDITFILGASATGNVVEIIAPEPNRVFVEGITFKNANGITRTAGASLQISGGSSAVNVASEVRRCHFHDVFIGLSWYNAFASHTMNNFFSDCFHGTDYYNPYNSDAGDHFNYGNYYASFYPENVQIAHYSGAGMRIQGNKFIGGNTGSGADNGLGAAAYALSVKNGGASTGLIHIVNNNVEAMMYAFLFQREDVDDATLLSGNNSVQNNIVDNMCIDGIAVAVVDQGGVTGWVNQFTITGNRFATGQGTMGVVLDSVNQAYIGNNHFIGVNNSNTAMIINASCTNTTIGINAYNDITTKLLNYAADTNIKDPEL